MTSNILKKPHGSCKDPDKKSKVVKDLLDLCGDFNFDKYSLKFAVNSYIKFPPREIEFLAPMLLNLNETNLDIKSEVANRPDTARSLCIEMNEIHNK